MAALDLSTLGVQCEAPSKRRGPTRALYASPLTDDQILHCRQGAQAQDEHDHPPESPVRYTLSDGDGYTTSLTFAEFVAVNGELHSSELDAIRLLATGETYRIGGGAQPEWTITRGGQHPKRSP